MNSRIETVLDEWRFRACDPGYAGLTHLADQEFSGAVVTNGTYGFMVNGRLIAIDGGTIESYWSTEFDALESEDPALPLLCAMWLNEDGVEAEYYTGETPITAVDETLTQGNFTGFIELSENVYSGDYYVVYYGGRSFSVAFVGTDERLVTGSEAFDRANDEVGIFEVKRASIQVIDIPDPEVDDSLRMESSGEPEPPVEPESTVEEEQRSGEPVEPEPVRDEPADSGASPAPQAQATANTTADSDPVASSPKTDDDEALASLAAAAQGGGDTAGAPLSVEDLSAIDGEVVLMPSLDPGRTTQLPEPDAEEPVEIPDTIAPDVGAETSVNIPDADAMSTELAEAEATIESLEVENEKLRSHIAELETEIAQLEEELAAANPQAAPTGLTASEAIAGTNLFVRYRSKAEVTLEDVVKGGGDAAALDANIQLEWHTEFEADDLTVEDEPFSAFLQDSTYYRFAWWLLTSLIFELRDTGAAKELIDVYDVLPTIDRIEFDGEVPVQTTSNGKRESAVHEFDVVCRSSMGEPLLVADLNTSREPVDGEAISTLITSTNEVASGRPSVVGAMFVTNSFFEPAALEAVDTATDSGFLRSGSKASYVRVSRKRGFHLCLVEARDDAFHLTIPEL